MKAQQKKIKNKHTYIPNCELWVTKLIGLASATGPVTQQISGWNPGCLLYTPVLQLTGVKGTGCGVGKLSFTSVGDESPSSGEFVV